MGWGKWGRSLIFVCLLGVSNLGVAGGLGAFNANLMNLINLNFSIGLSKAVVKDQGYFPYCALFAMSSWLEIWRDEKNKPTTPGPSLDPAFLALAFNYEFGSSNGGTNVQWLLTSVQKWGIIPEGSIPDDTDVKWPITDWRKEHETLIAEARAKSILEGYYRHPSVPYRFTGAQYLNEIVRIDLRDHGISCVIHDETYLSSPRSDRKPPTYRFSSLGETYRHMMKLASNLGMNTDAKNRNPETFYDLVVKELYAHRPVFVDLNLGVTKGRFMTAKNLPASSLVEENKGTISLHSVVAVAHCDDGERTAMCDRIQSTVEKVEDREGLILQNSWGREANDAGYFFVGRRQLLHLMWDGVLPN